MNEENYDNVEVLNELPDDVLEQIVGMEGELFPEALRWNEDEFRTTLSSPTPKVVAYDENGRVIGYIISQKHNDAYGELKEDDPDMEDIPDAVYLSSIGIHPEHQGKGYFSKLVKKFIDAVGGKHVTAHARVVNNCSLGLQKHGAKFMHSVDDWSGSGETFDYLIIPPRGE
jgi:ribosomal protein S18 acetylase RimI-like enzyme